MSTSVLCACDVPWEFRKQIQSSILPLKSLAAPTTAVERGCDRKLILIYAVADGINHLRPYLTHTTDSLSPERINHQVLLL